MSSPKGPVSVHPPIFTPAPLVQHMCDLCEPLLSSSSHKVFEPGCGTGNFLVEILARRLRNIKNPATAIIALSNLYGVDIDLEYLVTARNRLKTAILSRFSEQPLDYRFLPLIELILDNNLIHADLIKNREVLTFVDWQPISDFEFHPIPVKLENLLNENSHA